MFGLPGIQSDHQWPHDGLERLYTKIAAFWVLILPLRILTNIGEEVSQLPLERFSHLYSFLVFELDFGP